MLAAHLDISQVVTHLASVLNTAACSGMWAYCNAVNFDPWEYRLRTCISIIQDHSRRIKDFSHFLQPLKDISASNREGGRWWRNWVEDLDRSYVNVSFVAGRDSIICLVNLLLILPFDIYIYSFSRNAGRTTLYINFYWVFCASVAQRHSHCLARSGPWFDNR